MYAFRHELRNLALVFLIPRSAITQNPVLSAQISAMHGDSYAQIATGERTRYLECRGKGSPTVFLESDIFLQTTHLTSPPGCETIGGTISIAGRSPGRDASA